MCDSVRLLYLLTYREAERGSHMRTSIRINRVVCGTGRHQLDADGCVTMVSDSRVS